MSNKEGHNEHWDSVIGPKKGNLSLDLGEVWRYRDLLLLFVKKDIVTVYKQTVLGPIWFLLQPVLTTAIYIAVFANMANMNEKEIPPILFFLGSITLWNYFSETMTTTSKTFTDNAAVFGKVYFPRLVLPVSKVVSGLVKFLIQFALFMVFWLYYTFVTHTVHPNWHIVFFPLFLLVMAALGLGIGLFVTSMTTKYRDLTFLIAFGVQLGMYATPVIYPLSKFHKYRGILLFNPLTSLFEAFKFAFLGKGFLSYTWLLYSLGFTLVVLILGILTFNKVEKRFIDTV